MCWVATTSVLQVKYCFSARSQDKLPQVAEGQAGLAGVVSVTKRVYASPSQTTVNLGTSKAAAAPSLSYPLICFAVDTFEDAFENVVRAPCPPCTNPAR